MFAHLRSHSHYSLLKALPKVDELVAKAKELRYEALALTDYNNMYGAIEFYKACKAEGIKPIIGLETTILDLEGGRHALTLLAKTETGYKSLMKIISVISTNDLEGHHEPTLTDSILKREALDLIILSGGPWGDVSKLLINNEASAIRRIKFYQSVATADDFYLEISPHSFMDYGKEMCIKTIECAKKNNIKIVATQNPHYLSINDKNAHKTLMTISGSEESSDYYNQHFKNGDFHFFDKKEMDVFFKDTKDALLATKEISDKCNVELKLGNWVFPNIVAKNNYDTDLRDLAYEGLKVRDMELNDVVKTRIEYELKVISDKGFSPYFLVVNDLLAYAREHNILTNIRGSVAGSLVTYLLQITKCDPLSYKLPFERFLNPERPSAPDIDMDYADNRRDEMINYARGKYGMDNVAQIGTFGTMMARGAVKDVSRAMKFPYTLGDRISKLIPPPRQGFPVSIDLALKEVPELKEMYDGEREVQIILDMAKKLEGCARHISVHAAGTVISPVPLWEFTPIQKDPKGGKIITQYDMYTIEEAGLLKFDFLGIRNLTILGDAILLVKERYGTIVDIEAIPLDDKKTFEMLARGETEGLFQLNGSGMTRFLKELEPSTIFDINAMVALYRPGPLEIIPEYIRRKKDPSLIKYMDPRLEPILDQSYGLITYQDDVMLIAIHLAGYSWLEADKLRKAMGKKIPAEMKAQRSKLIDGFISNGLSKKDAEELWRLIEPFAAYGFNKAHAASYGRVAYQTAYMKANFPAPYMTAILTNESGDIDKIAQIVTECKRMGIAILPPNINSSVGGFTVKNNKKTDKEEILFGLYTIKGLGNDIADAIILERAENGDFKSFEDFLTRVTHKNLNKRSLEALTRCGALDDLASRGDILHNMDDILDYHKKVVKDNSNQGNLFGSTTVHNFKLKKGIEVPHLEKLHAEKELLGLYVSGFPLDPWKEKIKARGRDIDYILHKSGDHENISFPALIDQIRITKTKRGEQMALLKVRDYSGLLEVAVFPETYKKIKSMCLPDKTVIVKGKVATRNNEKTLIVDDLTELTNPEH